MHYLDRVKISVVVPAFNEEKLLALSLAKIREAAIAFSRRGWQFELVVCDNNSTDRTAEIARAAGTVVIFEPYNQIGRARNTGASVATGDWLIFVDADSHPSEGLFADVAEQINSGHCLAGGSTVRLDATMFFAGALTRVWNLTSRLKRWLAGSFIFVEAEAFRKAGGFDTELFAAEELVLSENLKKLARKQKRKIIILHRHPLLTSARKMKLYRPREFWGFFVRSLFSPRKIMRSREAAYMWYDGRR